MCTNVSTIEIIAFYDYTLLNCGKFLWLYYLLQYITHKKFRNIKFNKERYERNLFYYSLKTILSIKYLILFALLCK